MTLKLGLSTYDKIYNTCWLAGIFINMNMLSGLIKKLGNFLLSGVYNFIGVKWKVCVTSLIFVCLSEGQRSRSG